jgi:polyhydroxyalkanoate synthase
MFKIEYSAAMAAAQSTPQPDSELIDATIEAITSNLPAGLDRGQAAAATGRLARSLVRQPGAPLRHGVSLATEGAKIAIGTSDVQPHRKDRRFKDEAWSKNPVYKRLGQAYLTWDREVHGLVDDLTLDEKSKLRAEFLLNLFTETVAPTNSLLGNPAALKKARETKGRSLVDGARHALHDLRHNGGMPSMVDSRPFTPGDTVAATPGEVVFRNAVLELIQYEPTTDQVYVRPMVVVPPQINKYYILDLAPGRSMMEHLVTSGHQTFAISWRNPGPEQRDWDLNTYVAAIIEATDAAIEITGSKDVNILGVCAGGITTAAMLGHLAEIKDKRVKAASFLVTILDWDVPSTMGTFISGPVVEASKRRSQSKGVLRGDDLNRIFAWLRPNDLVWNYWVNNYLMGENPPAFDVLSWNGDSTNLPAALHGDFMNMAVENSMTKADEVMVLDTPIDMADIDVPAFVVGAVTDHITPWQACYETVNLVGGKSEFVLSSQGHIQALVNPAGNPKGEYKTNKATPDTPGEWLEEATSHNGSWWDYWIKWLKPKAGAMVAAPQKLGSDLYSPIEPAPGSYVLD